MRSTWPDVAESGEFGFVDRGAQLLGVPACARPGITERVERPDLDDGPSGGETSSTSMPMLILSCSRKR